MSDLEPYDYGEGSEEGDGMSGGTLTKWIAARAGRKVDRTRTDNRRSIVNLFSSTTVINDNRRSVFGGRERRAREVGVMYPQYRRKTIPVGAILGVILIVLAGRYHAETAAKIGAAMFAASILWGALFYGRKARF